ncbi:MAG: prepilin-type N-terminal cleavage/methylation domain-containing protein [Acidobacteriota bacterium]|nr:prepilin-type N-terminal cleavage/methylation domain-containing protein [Acidobacteriota bacterium]
MSRQPVPSTTPSRLPPSERGFSLVEMLAVLAIVGLTAAIGVYTIDLAGWRASSAASDVARRIELARSRAVFEQNDYRVIFDTASNSYRVHDDENSNGSIDADISESVTTYHLSTQGGGNGLRLSRGHERHRRRGHHRGDLLFRIRSRTDLRSPGVRQCGG